ncbi:MAG TPA: hypothetical protein VGK00_13220 [Anaerolineales bacterium]|jgi:hypothetical protein
MMGSKSMLFHAVAVFILLFAQACSTPAAPQPTATSSTPPASPQSQEKDFEDFDPANFDQSTRVDNQWFPLKPGTEFVYEGTTVEEGQSVPHRLIITVTDLTKVVGGVRSVVTWDRDFSMDVLAEAELAMFAQDKQGNVWRMGEYPEEYENGKVVAAPTWIHGFQDAHAGIAMQANPRLGTPSYSEGWGPAVDWTDRGKVDQMGVETCVPGTCYKDVLVIAESSKTEVGAFQLKHYAPGLGNILTDWRGADQSQEKLDLVSIKQLNASELAEVRAQAIELEKHAYKISKMYAQTLPMEYPEGTPTIMVLPTSASTVAAPSGPVDEIVVYASDLAQADLSELEFMEDAGSPAGKFIGIPNNGDELDPPPENDPHATLTFHARNGTPYRCWIHMKVGAPKGKSQANVIWVQFSGAVDGSNNPTLQPGSASYLTARGPQKEGWTWVGCNLDGTNNLVTFQPGGEVTVRLQAGMEGVGFDQLVLSAANFINEPPSKAVVDK